MQAPRIIGLALPSLLLASPPLWAQDWVEGQLDQLVALYRQFHQKPELSYREKATARRLAAALAETGARVCTGVGGHGVVALMENGEGPTIMLRADLDALPIAEKTGLPYRSKIYAENEKGQAAGIMHACGHDIHMTTLVGVARYFKDHKKLWRGTLMFIGQPAEERSGGARAMLKDGLFVRFPKPDCALALHVHPTLPAGSVGLREGPSMANVDSVDITMLGVGGHGAAPQACIDPIVQAAELVMALQTIVSREISPTDPAVITVGSIHGGIKHNIISDRCQLQLTLRSYSDTVRQHLKTAILRKAKAVAQGARAPEPLFEFSEGTPALENDPALTRRVTEALRRALGKEKVVGAERVMTAEDFARYGRAGVPICMFRLGSVAQERLERLKKAGKSPPPLHSSYYYPDARQTLRAGITAMSAVAMEMLSRPK